MKSQNRAAAVIAALGLAVMTLGAAFTHGRPPGNTPAAKSVRPIASEYNAIRKRAKVLVGRLHSANAAEAARAENEWAAVLRDLEAWASKYQVRLATRNLTSKDSGTSAPPKFHPPNIECKDISNLGRNGSAAGDNSAGHWYLQKRSGPAAKAMPCVYLCVPAEVIQQPDIDDSPYPSGSSQP